MSKSLAPSRFQSTAALLACLLLATPSGVQAQQAAGICRAPPQEVPCGVQGGAGAPEPDLDTGFANPILLATGEKFLRETDLPAPVDGHHPSFVRLYRHTSTEGDLSGSRWRSEYDIRLSRRATGWEVRMADGTSFRYSATGAPLQGSPGHLEPLEPPASPATPGAVAHAWIRDNGQRLDFDRHGRLVALRAGVRTLVRIERHAAGPLGGRIHRLDGAAASLTLQYELVGQTARLRALDTPLGTFRYEYDGARLTRVRRPDGMSRQYHHEPEHQGGDPDAITGITLVDRGGRARRMRYWAYDDHGRVLRAAPRAPNSQAPALALEYDPPDHQSRVRHTRIRQGPLQTEIAYGPGQVQPAGARTWSCEGCPAREHPVRRDSHGRLIELAGLQIVRDADGSIRRLMRPHGGWPGLIIEHDATGRRTAWSSDLTGRTQARFDAGGLLQALVYANGDRVGISRTAAGRPARLRYQAPGQDAVTVDLRWTGPRLTQVSHPAEQEDRSHDAQGRLRERRVRRPHPAGTLHYRETFAYDDAGRLVRHDLPEGGALLYAWRKGPELNALIWESADGVRHPVIRREAGVAGYRYGNGLHLQARGGRSATVVVSDGDQPVWGERRTADRQGRVCSLLQFDLAGGGALERHYAYDEGDRLIAWRDAPGVESGDAPHDAPRSRAFTAGWLAWAPDGRLVGRRVPGGQPTPAAAIERDRSGLPGRVGRWRLRYQAQRLLAEAVPEQGPAIHFTRNAQGHLIRRREGARETERYYLDNRLVALWHRPATDQGASFGVSQRYLYAHEVPVGLLQTAADGSTQLYYVHTDFQGIPVRVTGQSRAVHWSARYDALGRAHVSGDIDLPLRAPGQDEDPTTGWHDNVFRTYLPEHGQYLEPDPLGPVPGQQALGYAAQQPMRLADPLGLILLAFDGTRYGAANHGNVWKLAQIYQDGPTFYHAGPGNDGYIDWDAITASSSNQILRNQWQSLLNALQRAQGSSQPVPIDLLGFSRGAALARDFANRIAAQTRNGWFSYDDPLRGNIALCVDLRFLGLFDTVAQFGLLGAANAGYDLTIAGAWQWVAHAVALHEYRALFPLVLASGGAPDGILEAPFIGAHADIGGGMVLDDNRQPVPSGDLGDVALNWMRWQALAALVPFGSLPEADRQATLALLHDERLPMDRILENSDRTLQDASTHSLGLQRQDPRLGARQRRAFEAFIQRAEQWQTAPGNVVGTVDMQGYDAWLQAELGLPPLAAPAQHP